MKNTLPAWIARCLLAGGLAGSPLGLLAQGNVEVTPSFELAPGTSGNYTLNVAVNLNTPDAVVRAEHYLDGVFQTDYASTRSTNKYTAALTIPATGLNQGLIRAYSDNAPATTFAADFLYTIVTNATLRNYPKVTDRLGRVSFTPSAADRLNPYPNNSFLQRLMIVSTDYAPLLKNIPVGWRPAADLVAVTATTNNVKVTSFQQNGLLEIGYQDWRLAPAEELTMSLFKWNETALVWDKLACPQPDTLLDRMSVNIAGTGTYALLSMLSENNTTTSVVPGQQEVQVAATSLRTASAIDSLGTLLARGGTEVILTDGFFAFRGSQFDTQLTGTHCVATSGAGNAARELFAGSAAGPETAEAGPGLLPAAPLPDNRTALVHPNPAGSEFTFTYRVRDAQTDPASYPSALAGRQPVTIRLYDLSGRLKAVVLDGDLREPGIHQQTVRAVALRPALYVLELRIGNEPRQTFKVLKQ